jgi:hypothetical protein
MKSICTLILLAVSLALTGCGKSDGEKALEALRAREADPGYTASDLAEVAQAYTEVASKYPDVAERALTSAQRVNAEVTRRNELIRKATEELMRSSRSTY